jgi:acetyltransferase-like isoleucine patch superfamily enzyme
MPGMTDRIDGTTKLDAAQGGSPGSAMGAYQDLVLGSRSLLRLAHYEFVVAWGAVLPGALGLAFRQLTWRGSLFGRIGRGSIWERNIRLWHPRKMWIGDRVAVDEGCQLDARGCAPGEFRIGDGALISRGCILSGKDGSLSIGPRANIGAGCVMYSFTRIEIGADTMLAANCYVGGGGYVVRGRTDIPMSAQPRKRLGVVIEDDCWLGAGVTVIDGVRVGRGSVIGAGAVVTHDVAPYSIMAGVPARRIGSRSTEAREG